MYWNTTYMQVCCFWGFFCWLISTLLEVEQLQTSSCVQYMLQMLWRLFILNGLMFFFFLLDSDALSVQLCFVIRTRRRIVLSAGQAEKGVHVEQNLRN